MQIATPCHGRRGAIRITPEERRAVNQIAEDCPSCNTHGMAETAAHLVDQVFPQVPVRQWVPSLPKRLRYL